MDFSDFKKHPSPLLMRRDYILLEDGWSIDGRDVKVPFPPESELSLFSKNPSEEYTYETAFKLRRDWNDGHVILHLGAVDQIAEITLNGHFLARHTGGYLPFSIDITNFLHTINHLKVRVIDRTSTSIPYGKQSKMPGGMWYTGISGIWKEVWLEHVPDKFIKRIRLTPDLNGVHIKIYKNTSDNFGFSAELISDDKKRPLWHFEGDEGYVPVSVPKYWTPENPYLYRLKIKYLDDEIETYFALRTIKISNVDGVKRVLLNNKPIFLNGILDQGYYPKGIFLPETYKGYEDDINLIKSLGFNMIRMHIKVENEAFYFACDRLGILVMQDMVESGHYNFILDTVMPFLTFGIRSDYHKLGMGQPRGGERERRKIFLDHTKDTVVNLYNHPSIIAWTIFNEGWGQFESDRFYRIVRKLDSSRLIDTTSGWFAQKESDFDSRHQYFQDRHLHSKNGKPLFISECGGYTYDIKVENKDNGVNSALRSYDYSSKEKELAPGEKRHGLTFGYGECHSKEQLTKRIEELYDTMVFPAIPEGLVGIVYTQLTDIEDEINGIITFDRKNLKVIPERIKALGKRCQGILKNSVSTDIVKDSDF